MKQTDMILKALEDGPGTSNEISVEIGLNTKTVSAVLCCLANQGLILRSHRTIRENPSGRESFIWILASQWEAAE